jgi:hypothetical protein
MLTRTISFVFLVAPEDPRGTKGTLYQKEGEKQFLFVPSGFLKSFFLEIWKYFKWGLVCSFFGVRIGIKRFGLQFSR